MSGFCKAELTVIAITCSHGGSERARGLLKDTQLVCQHRAGAGTQASGFLAVHLFHFIIICETVFSCSLSLGTSPSPRSPWKKVRCCFLISLAAFHFFQVLMALPIMQCSKQMLGCLLGPLPCQIVQNMMVSSSAPECKFSFQQPLPRAGWSDLNPPFLLPPLVPSHNFPICQG